MDLPTYIRKIEELPFKAVLESHLAVKSCQLVVRPHEGGYVASIDVQTNFVD